MKDFEFCEKKNTENLNLEAKNWGISNLAGKKYGKFEFSAKKMKDFEFCGQKNAENLNLLAKNCGILNLAGKNWGFQI